MSDSKTAIFTAVVRKVGGSCVITVPHSTMTAMDIRPKDYINVKVAKMKEPLAEEEKAKKKERAAKKEEPQYLYEL